VSDQIVRQNGTNPTDKIIIIKKNKIANQNKNNFITRSPGKFSNPIRKVGFLIFENSFAPAKRLENKPRSFGVIVWKKERY